MDDINTSNSIDYKTKVIHLNGICRTCMSSRGEMRSLFQAGVSDRKLYIIKEMIMSFALIEVMENDGLPSLICTECIENTQKAFDFKKQCENSDAELRKFISFQKSNTDSVQVKSENLEIDTIEELQCNIIEPKIELNDNVSSTVQKNPKTRIKGKKVRYKAVEIQRNIITSEENIDIDNFVENDSSQLFYPCSKCIQCYSDQKDLKRHMKTSHGKPKNGENLFCDICNQSFSQTQTLARHMKIHQQNQRTNLCTVCGKSFHRTDDLKRHSRIHTGERPYSCDQCPKSYKQSSELKDHIKSHSTAKHYMCTECGKSLATRNGLYVHMKVHRGEKNHICKVCGNKYVTTGELTSHMNHIHSQVKPYVCSYEGCLRAFVTKLSLMTHTRSHTGEKPFQCPVCNKSLATASSLHDHKRTHTGEKLKVCNVCGRKLGNGQALKKHLRIHSGERPYQCSTCLENFICSSSLNSHIKIKHMEKQHQCSICHKMFALPTKLRQHMRLHTNEKDSTCSVCGSCSKLCQHIKDHDLQKQVQPLSIELMNETRLMSQVIPVAQLTMPQMIIPHYI